MTAHTHGTFGHDHDGGDAPHEHPTEAVIDVEPEPEPEIEIDASTDDFSTNDSNNEPVTVIVNNEPVIEVVVEPDAPVATGDAEIIDVDAGDDGDEPGPDELDEPPAGEPEMVTVPPQPDDDGTPAPAGGGRSVSAFRKRRHR